MLTSIALVVTSFLMFISSFSVRLTSALEKNGSCVQISCNMCNDEVARKYIIASTPEGWWYYFSLKEAS